MGHGLLLELHVYTLMEEGSMEEGSKKIIGCGVGPTRTADQQVTMVFSHPNSLLLYHASRALSSNDL